MTLQELITDLKAAGANENTVRLAMNCYELGKTDEREACAKACDAEALFSGSNGRKDSGAANCADAIRARGQS